VSLRHVVPTLGALALVSAAPAIEVGDLTIGGFVDTVLFFQDSDLSGTTSGGSADSIIDFTADAELQFGYKVGDSVTAQVDVELDAETNGIATEQAYVSWGVTDQVTLTLGKVETLIGYEAVDAPDLWRVGGSLVADVTPGPTTGLNVGFAASEQLSVDVYIVDGLYLTDSGTHFLASTAPGKTSEDISFGLSATYTDEKFFVDVDFAIDTGADSAVTPGDGDISMFGINGEFTGVEKLTVFGDLQMISLENEDIMAILIGANYAIDDTKSVTAMVSMLDVDTLNVSPMEIAVALLTNPTGDANFAVNYELSIYDSDDSTIGHLGSGNGPSVVGPNADATTFGVEFLAVIP
jgi:hypothetical protein